MGFRGPRHHSADSAMGGHRNRDARVALSSSWCGEFFSFPSSKTRCLLSLSHGFLEVFRRINVYKSVFLESCKVTLDTNPGPNCQNGGTQTLSHIPKHTLLAKSYKPRRPCAEGGTSHLALELGWAEAEPCSAWLPSLLASLMNTSCLFSCVRWLFMYSGSVCPCVTVCVVPWGPYTP